MDQLTYNAVDTVTGKVFNMKGKTYPVFQDQRGREFIMKNKKTRKYIDLPPVDKHARYARGHMGKKFDQYSGYRDQRRAKLKEQGLFMSSVE